MLIVRTLFEGAYTGRRIDPDADVSLLAFRCAFRIYPDVDPYVFAAT